MTLHCFRMMTSYRSTTPLFPTLSGIAAVETPTQNSRLMHATSLESLKSVRPVDEITQFILKRLVFDSTKGDYILYVMAKGDASFPYKRRE